MRHPLLFGASGLAVCLALSVVVRAGSHNLGDYPLRVHIFQFNSHSHYYRSGGNGGISSLDMVDGEGRANLYQNGEPRGFDFSYRCSERLRGSAGFETYPARWKKPNQDLEILLPVMGKPGAFDSCEMKVEMKDNVYFRHAGMLDEEPAQMFKQWMEKHQYDPEHGKNEPVAVAPAPTGTGAGTTQ